MGLKSVHFDADSPLQLTNPSKEYSEQFSFVFRDRVTVVRLSSNQLKRILESGATSSSIGPYILFILAKSHIFKKTSNSEITMANHK